MSKDIFIVEDSKVYAAACRKILTGLGYEYEMYSDGRNAWQAITKDPPRILLLDWNLPSMDGIEICRKMRHEMTRPYVYVIMLTTNDKIEDMVTGFEAGADDYMVKPFENAVLEAKIKVGFRICDLEQKLARKMDQLEQSNMEQERLIHSMQEKNQIIQQQSDELRSTQNQLLEAARKAGMAEIATSVLHNVGNLLNTAVTSSAIIRETIDSSKLSTMRRLNELLMTHNHDFVQFVTQDSRGQKLPTFLQELYEVLFREQGVMRQKMFALNESIEQIRQIIALQHRYVGVAGVTEKLSIQGLIQDAVKLFLESFKRHDITVIQDLSPSVPEILVEKHKILQILMNVLKNACDATKSTSHGHRIVHIRLFLRDPSTACIDITDNGGGIKPENLNRIFNFGFTTKSDGHGFGLHSCANMAREMGGALTAKSEGEGKGATFSLLLPIE